MRHWKDEGEWHVSSYCARMQPPDPPKMAAGLADTKNIRERKQAIHSCKIERRDEVREGTGRYFFPCWLGRGR
jgi:hypothetical protein